MQRKLGGKNLEKAYLAFQKKLALVRKEQDDLLREYAERLAQEQLQTTKHSKHSV